MNRTFKIYISSLTILFVLSYSIGFSQDQQSRPTRQAALDAFSKGNFELALIQFNELSLSYPRDPLYKYYCGVLLVKLEKDPVKAVTLLREALMGSAAIRAVPLDATFYLGRAQQLSGEFNEAIKSYNLYTEQAGKKTAKEILTPNYIEQCNKKEGEVRIAKTAEKVNIRKDSIPSLKQEKISLNEKSDNHDFDTTKKKDVILPPDYEKLVNKALDFQFRADSLSKLADLYHKQLKDTLIIDNSELRTKIADNEKLAGMNQKMANEILLPIFSEPVGQKVENKINKDTVSQVAIKEKVERSGQKQAGIYSIFEVIAKPVNTAKDKVQINPEVPPGLVYRIQLAVFKNIVPPSYFKGINPVYGFKGTASDATTYYAGMFRKLTDASKALIKVKSAGFKDAFVAALFDKKMISVERAGVLEKEWGNKSLVTAVIPQIQDTPKDTIPPTLIFRVEVARTQKPLNTEQLDLIKRLAGNRGLDIIKNSSGQNIYLIGKFLTFESAAEYTDLLTRNGQKEAKVAAYLGRREIPVETAKQLFEKF
jgi:hypothetical protein